MFDFIFGWRKASKCKKLIRKVQCRLNLLSNKRSFIVRQLRNDVAQLIRHGHYQTAFERAEQIYKDECIVVVYDLLALFCEFVSLHLSYIRRNKDCPNDINEAISSLIFASARSRCGDLPELIRIRELFGERYGQQFEATALKLLPGNLVNSEIKENLSIKNVSNAVKYKLIEEITTMVLQEGPFALEFTSEQHQQATKSDVNQHVGSSPNRFDFDHPTVDKDRSMIIDRVDAEPSLENSTTNVPGEIVDLDDIEEFQTPLDNDENGTDQRVFVFQSSTIVPVIENHKLHPPFNDFNIEKYGKSRNETKAPKRRSRKRPVSSDIERSVYYDNASRHRKVVHENKRRSGYTCTYLADHISPPLPGGENHLLVKPIRGLGIGSRALTMPCKRSTKCLDENGVMRSNSLPVQPSLPHVHPKLPDYDELAAKFMALKKQTLQNQKVDD